MKKLFALFTIFGLLFSVSACSSSENGEGAGGHAEEALNEQTESKIYNAVRIAEGKVNEIFHKELAVDETTPVINSNFADEKSSVEFLSRYYSEETAKKIYHHYATAEKTAEGQMIVNAEPFFSPSFLETTKEDVTFKGDAEKITLKTSDLIYEVSLEEGKYIVTNVKK